MPPKAAKTGSRIARAQPLELSIVVPLFNEARSLAALHTALGEVARRLTAERGLHIEVIYVDDGSVDATYRVASELPADALDVQAVALSRNFGKEAALLAGLDHARFSAVMFMDGDGQHPPELVETLVARWLDDGYDVVYTAKAHRANEPWPRRAGVRSFYSLINWGSRHKIPEDAGDFRLLSPRATAALRQLPERNRFLKGLSSWIGFRQIRVAYEPATRTHGKTSWSIWTLLALSIEGITSFSVAPLRIASLLGIILAASALCFGVWMLLETIIYGKDVPGYPSLVVGLMVLGGVQLILVGVLGEYVGKLLWEIKARPVYLVADHQVKSAGERSRAKSALRAAP